MAETNYRDAYVVVSLFSGKQPVYQDKVTFLDQKAYDSNYCEIGTIESYVEDVVSVGETIDQLRKDNAIVVNTSKAVYLNWRDLVSFEVTSGAVVAVVNNLAVVYIGVLDVVDTDIRYAQDVLDEMYDNIRYTVTDEGLKFLEELQENERNGECENVCPEEREENSTMDNLFGNLGFGKIKDTRFKLSMNGIAVAQSNGKYVVYNKENNEFVDVTSTLFDIKDALFSLPAVEVSVGDTVIHENKPYYIVDTTNEIKAVSYEDCTQTVLIPKSTMFGIKYFTKVFSMFGDNFAATGDLFSNPMVLMALIDGKNSDLTQLMLLSALNNGDLGSNPMALAMLLKGDKSDDSLSTIAMLSMLNNGTNPFAPKKKAGKTPTNLTNNN